MNHYNVHRRTDGLLIGHAYIVTDSDVDDIEYIKAPKDLRHQLLTNEDSFHIADENCNNEPRPTKSCIDYINIEDIAAGNQIQSEDRIDHEVDLSRYSSSLTYDSNRAISGTDKLIDNFNYETDFSKKVEQSDLTTYKYDNNVSVRKDLDFLKILRKPLYWGFQRICRIKKDPEKGKVRVTSVRYVSRQYKVNGRTFLNTRRDVMKAIQNIPELKIDNFIFGARVHGLGEDFEIVTESNRDVTPRTHSNRWSRNPEELEKYIKLFYNIPNDNRNGKVLCYFCNLVIAQKYINKHMTKYHLPRNICFRCGEDKADGPLHVGDHCNNSKVEFSYDQENGECEEGSSQSINKCIKESLNKTSIPDEGSSNLPTIHSVSEGYTSLVTELVGTNNEDESTDVRENDEEHNKKIEESVRNVVLNEDNVVIIVMSLEGMRSLRIVSKSMVKMRQIMGRFGRRMGLDWRKLSFTDEKGMEVSEDINIGNLTGSLIQIKRKEENGTDC